MECRPQAVQRGGRQREIPGYPNVRDASRSLLPLRRTTRTAQFGKRVLYGSGAEPKRRLFRFAFPVPTRRPAAQSDRNGGGQYARHQQRGLREDINGCREGALYCSTTGDPPRRDRRANILAEGCGGAPGSHGDGLCFLLDIPQACTGYHRYADD